MAIYEVMRQQLHQIYKLIPCCDFFSLNLLRDASSAVLDGLLGVCAGQEHDGVELGVVKLVHGIGRHVEQRVLALVHDVPDGGQPHDPGLAALTRGVQLCRWDN